MPEKKRRKLPRAWSVTNIMDAEHELLEFEGEWYQAFDRPEAKGVWFIWGQSGAGKNSFILELIKELIRFEKVVVNDLEEGNARTVTKAFHQYGMGVAKKKLLWTEESMEIFSDRLSRPKSPNIAIINSYQYTEMSFKDYLRFKKKHRNKLLIFISQAEGKKPMGRAANSVMYDASLKIWIEGYKAFSKGRYIGPNGGTYTIWEEGAALYHGTENDN